MPVLLESPQLPVDLRVVESVGIAVRECLDQPRALSRRPPPGRRSIRSAPRQRARQRRRQPQPSRDLVAYRVLGLRQRQRRKDDQRHERAQHRQRAHLHGPTGQPPTLPDRDEPTSTHMNSARIAIGYGGSSNDKPDGSPQELTLVCAGVSRPQTSSRRLDERADRGHGLTAPPLRIAPPRIPPEAAGCLPAGSWSRAWAESSGM